MIDYDSMSFNELISGQIMRALTDHDPQFGELSHDQVANRVTRYCFMGALAKINGLSFFPKVAEFCDGSLHACCDPTVLTRGLFSPLSITGDKLIVAVANPWSPLPEEYLAPRFPELELVKVVTLASEISRAIESVATNSGPSRSELEAIDVEDSDDGIRDFDVTTEHSEPMAQLVATVMAEAVKSRASDIHFKVEKESFYYAYRVDGDIGHKVEIPMKLKDRLDAFLLNLMKLPTEIRATAPGISGRFTISYFHRPIDIRYERHRTYRGYHITMRLLDKSNINVTLGKGTLAFDEETLFELNKVMKVPAGIIVMSGPTGSGKSTTLNAILRELNRPDVNILTLENPVEDEVPGITHCDLKSPKEFKPMIASFMRSDPDIILMGEVRDIESAELAIEAAVTGHKVLTTIHTPRASQIIERFEQLGVERWKIAQTLKAACAQRLVKLLCPYCKEAAPGISEHDRRTFNLDDSWASIPVFSAKSGGCAECRNSGYSGRTAILEIIPITPKTSDMLSKGEISPYDLEIKIQQEGKLPNLRRSGLRLLREGKTDIDAIAKVIDMTYTDE
ncbi:MAG: general secretion pathway protein GspE [Verrucomicrobia bacterium]|nr:MAG: general secretion pathway protein GspE [Verrucomicrobiota bacterium]TAE88875.1 MAG: general secretion pathway protein GspE [Verrucomicrobiota bacterium]TAF27292.1 MAG: general secretion pathway protein GspE [Verrucomicrobiota bacterium]TAF42417.1 MAG: general secretion pathway protein GspE [Verrucomicrobiota bacterium]